MKAIVKSNWPNAKKGDVIDVSQHALASFPNHLEAVESIAQDVAKKTKKSSKKTVKK